MTLKQLAMTGETLMPLRDGFAFSQLAVRMGGALRETHRLRGIDGYRLRGWACPGSDARPIGLDSQGIRLDTLKDRIKADMARTSLARLRYYRFQDRPPR